MSVMDIGASALRTAYTRLQTTGHNIANVSTPGYTRQDALVTSMGSQFGVGGFVGGGVDVETVVRVYDQHLTREVHTASAIQSSDRARANALSRLDRLFSDTENGLGSRFDAFNLSVADMVNQPFDQAARTVAMQRAHNLAAAIGTTDTELDRIGIDADSQAEQLVSQLNERLIDLARLNQQIVVAGGSEHTPNDLLDQRDALIDSINEVLQTSAHFNDDHTVSLFAATGDALVLGPEPTTLSLERDPNNPEVMNLALVTKGRSVPLSQQMLGGGELSGLMTFRNDDLVDARARLGQMAGAIGSAYNRQQSLGIDADGNAGVDLFSIGQARAVQATTNSGNAQLSISISDGTALRATDYTLALTGGQYVLTRMSDDTTTTLPGLPTVFDGLDISLDSGSMAEGDSILLKTSSAFAGNFELAMQVPAQWATAYAALPILGEQNSGSLSVSQFDVVQPDPNLTEPVSMVFSATGSVIISGNGTGNPGPVPWQPGEPITVNGWQITLLGSPSAGDTITVAPPINTGTDNRNARAMLTLSEKPLIDGRPPAQAVGSLVGEVGARSMTAQDNANQSEAWHASAVAARDQVSGVNLDEEAARLLQFQQAYQAAARLISTSQTMFDSLMAATV